nr:hypothetical protein CFP56_34964 [Quercus suber]
MGHDSRTDLKDIQTSLHKFDVDFKSPPDIQQSSEVTDIVPCLQQIFACAPRPTRCDRPRVALSGRHCKSKSELHVLCRSARQRRQYSHFLVELGQSDLSPQVQKQDGPQQVSASIVNNLSEQLFDKLSDSHLDKNHHHTSIPGSAINVAKTERLIFGELRNDQIPTFNARPTLLHDLFAAFISLPSSAI